MVAAPCVHHLLHISNLGELLQSPQARTATSLNRFAGVTPRLHLYFCHLRNSPSTGSPWTPFFNNPHGFRNPTAGSNQESCRYHREMSSNPHSVPGRQLSNEHRMSTAFTSVKFPVLPARVQKGKPRQNKRQPSVAVISVTAPDMAIPTIPVFQPAWSLWAGKLGHLGCAKNVGFH